MSVVVSFFRSVGASWYPFFVPLGRRGILFSFRCASHKGHIQKGYHSAAEGESKNKKDITPQQVERAKQKRILLRGN
ncbi:hypothetical protein [Paenibacillus mucilaginosus]|uniref:hypothetical protein n=1 Tax=Paenibacillus mucilaginosus TaxID=61624 RepID=UPI003D246FBF